MFGEQSLNRSTISTSLKLGFINTTSALSILIKYIL